MGSFPSHPATKKADTQAETEVQPVTIRAEEFLIRPYRMEQRLMSGSNMVAVIQCVCQTRCNAVRILTKAGGLY